MRTVHPEGLSLVLGLGNPGNAYANTRHNAGIMVVERFAGRYGIRIEKKDSSYLWGEGTVGGTAAVAASPLTYMNSSGVAAKELVRDFRITPDSLVVVYDDCDLAPGRIRIRKSGGSGGHGGIASIIEALGTKDFPRLRVGIGRDPGRDLKEFVLTPFSADEKPAIEDAIERATLAIEAIITRGLDYAMNSFNREIRR